jgi:hypothetical protein
LLFLEAGRLLFFLFIAFDTVWYWIITMVKI